MMTNKDVFIKSKNFLNNFKISNCDNDIKILISYFSKMNLIRLFLEYDKKINFNFNKYWCYLKEYRDGKPIQYLTNFQYFCGYCFYLNENVLIPRYETEELVCNINIIINWLESINKNNLVVIDVGTGSGVIAIVLGLKNPQITIYASDITRRILNVARKNINLLKCKNVKLLKGDILKPFLNRKIKADILVFNPPYISKNEISGYRKTKFYEPYKSIFSDQDGFFFYRRIFEDWRNVMKEKCVLCFEYGFDQKEVLEQLVKIYFNKYEYKFLKDINCKWRMLFIYIL